MTHTPTPLEVLVEKYFPCICHAPESHYPHCYAAYQENAVDLVRELIAPLKAMEPQLSMSDELLALLAAVT